jgi:jagged-like protein
VTHENGLLSPFYANSGILLPGLEWHTRTHNGPTASLIYRIRVVCDVHYYNTTCTKFCRPRNDFFGHYTCDSHGDKVCLESFALHLKKKPHCILN